MIERTASLRHWAALIGISVGTLKRWLAADLGMVFQPIPHGSKFLIRERDVEIVYRKRVARADWTLIRGKKVAA